MFVVVNNEQAAVINNGNEMLKIPTQNSTNETIRLKHLGKITHFYSWK